MVIVTVLVECIFCVSSLLSIAQWVLPSATSARLPVLFIIPICFNRFLFTRCWLVGAFELNGSLAEIMASVLPKDGDNENGSKKSWH